jgi:hypothetical protein
LFSRIGQTQIRNRNVKALPEIIALLKPRKGLLP